MVRIAIPEEVREAHSIMRKSFNKLKSYEIETNTKGPGFDAINIVTFAPDLGLWWILDDNGPNKNVSYNAFGLGKPKEKDNLQDCEINYQYVFESFNYASVILIDDDNDLLLAHNGKIRGGKEIFWEKYKGNKVQLKTRRGNKKYALIGIVNSPDFPYQLLNFVQEINRIKKSVGKENARV